MPLDDLHGVDDRFQLLEFYPFFLIGMVNIAIHTNDPVSLGIVHRMADKGTSHKSILQVP